MHAHQYDDLNQYDIQNILKQSAEVIREVDAGSDAYTAEQLQHAQDTQRHLSELRKDLPRMPGGPHPAA